MLAVTTLPYFPYCNCRQVELISQRNGPTLISAQSLLREARAASGSRDSRMTFVTTFEAGECILHLDDSFCDRSRSVGKRWKGTFLQYSVVQEQFDRLCEFVSASEGYCRVEFVCGSSWN